MRKKEKFVDDGRTIANMNVDGMPWYDPASDKKESGAPVAENSKPGEPAEPLTFKETMAVVKGVTLASLLVGGVFVIVFTLFILFCRFVWFK